MTAAQSSFAEPHGGNAFWIAILALLLDCCNYSDRVGSVYVELRENSKIINFNPTNSPLIKIFMLR